MRLDRRPRPDSERRTWTRLRDGGRHKLVPQQTKTGGNYVRSTPRIPHCRSGADARRPCCIDVTGLCPRHWRRAVHVVTQHRAALNNSLPAVQKGIGDPNTKTIRDPELKGASKGFTGGVKTGKTACDKTQAAGCSNNLGPQLHLKKVVGKGKSGEPSCPISNRRRSIRTANQIPARRMPPVAERGSRRTGRPRHQIAWRS